MERSCSEFIGLLIATSGEVEKAYKEVIEEWSPEEPPITTLFACLGDRIVECLRSTDAEINRRLFELIEQAMDSGTELLKTAVATGLIESLVTQAWKDSVLLKEILILMGPRSRKYAEAWLAA